MGHDVYVYHSFVCDNKCRSCHVGSGMKYAHTFVVVYWPAASLCNGSSVLETVILLIRIVIKLCMTQKKLSIIKIETFYI